MRRQAELPILLTIVGRPAQSTCSAILILALLCATEAYAGDTHSADTPWTFSSLYSHSSLTGPRDDWNTLELELLYRASPALILGGRMDTRSREQGTDTLYSALFSYQASPDLEWHGSLRLAPSADFSPLQTYATGIAWRYAPRTTLLFDIERLNFPEGSVDQYKPGLTFQLTDRSFLTARYTYGRAFNASHYDAGSLRLSMGLPGSQKLVLGIAHGADPEKDPAVAGVILTSATTLSAYYHLPLKPRLELVLGVEHEDRRDIYDRTTATVGFVWRY
jgi:YaiO family outer membrane protein